MHTCAKCACTRQIPVLMVDLDNRPNPTPTPCILLLALTFNKGEDLLLLTYLVQVVLLLPH